jgi:hypothetical protein
MCWKCNGLAGQHERRCIEGILHGGAKRIDAAVVYRCTDARYQRHGGERHKRCNSVLKIADEIIRASARARSAEPMDN